ncbi:MAG: cytochrome c family protein [Thermoanaerobaculia bacterium]
MKTFRCSFFLAGGLALLLSAWAGARTPSYAGAKKCKMCHLKQFQTWEQTKMAKSFELLRTGVAAEAKKKANLDPQKDYTHDEKCLACHTTGYGKPGGFVSVEKTPELVGVQCESCHGPGSEYLKEGAMTLKNREYKRAEMVNLGLVLIDAETCTSQCHNNRSPFVGKDYVFNYEQRRTQGTHEHVPLKFEH